MKATKFRWVLNGTAAILLILIHTVSFSQINGTLLNSVSKTPVAYATIQATYVNQPVRFYLSDTNGIFAIDTGHLQKVYISCSGFVGLERTTEQSNASGWQFELSPAVKALDTVAIRAARPLVKGNALQITYDVVRDSTLKGSSAAEAVSRLPFISINASNNISYKNGRLFIVLVNGSRFGMLSNEPTAALKAIPASMIESVDLLLDPPLEYRLRGYDAVINIKTMPGFFKGTLGSIGGSISSIGEWESEPYLSFQRNQTYIQLNVATRGYDLDKSFESTYLQTGSNAFTRQTNSFNTRAKAARVGLSLDQRLSSRLRAGLYVNYYRSHFRDCGVSNVLTKKPVGEDRRAGATQLTGRKDYIEAGADFNQNYGSRKNSFSLLFRYYRETSRSSSWSGLKPLLATQFLQVPTELSLQLANSLMIKKGLTIESVLRLTRRHAWTNVETDSLVGSQWSIAVDEQKGKLLFNIANISNSIAYAAKNVSLRAGFSADYAVYRFESHSPPFTREALNIMPLASGNLMIAEGKYLSLVYRAKLYRPTYESLAAFVPDYDPLVVKMGNTRLGTQVEHRIAPEYSFYVGNKGNASYASLQFDFSNSFFNKYSLFDTAAGMRIISYRQSKYRSLNLVVGGEFEHSAKWSSNGSLNASLTRLGDNPSAVPVYSLYYSLLFKLNVNSGVQLLIDYKSRFVTSMGYLTGYGTYDLTLYRYFLNRKLQLSLLASNFLREDRVQTERINGASFQIDNIYRQPFRSFQLSASFRFGRLKTFAMNAKRLSTNDFRKID